MSLRLSSVVVSFCAALALAAPADLRSAFTHPRNKWNANTTISFPGSASFENATVRWNAYEGPDYSVAITPGTAEDAAKAVRIAKNHNVPLLATGGRHSSSTTLNEVEHGVAIDLGRLNSVAVDAAAGTLTVGGGTRFGQVVEPVYQAGFEMPLGSCACPGAVGATIGAGVGRFQGVFGLLIDQLRSVRIITADGKLITASETENSDLFWAVRGAGANFGVITSATYNLPRPLNNNQVLNADFTFAASKNASYFDLIQDLKGTMPAELATITITFWNDTAAEAQLLVNWVYIGPEDEGRKWIAPLEALGPLSSSISVIPYNKIYPTAIGGLGNTICGNDATSEVGYGINFANLSSSTYQTVFNKLSNFYLTHPDGRGSGIEMEVFAPQAVQKVPVTATAYPWRDSLGYSLISFTWNSTATQNDGQALAEEIRADYAATSGYPGLRVYVSYGHGNESPEQIWGVNLPRLEQLKAKWDPDNVFRFYHAITPKSG